jgi:hypothetical protein
LELHQTYDSASFLEEKEIQIPENDDYYGDNETSDELQIKYFNTVITYLEKLKKFSATILNLNLLELITKSL